jgi:hypothetical protein
MFSHLHFVLAAEMVGERGSKRARERETGRGGERRKGERERGREGRAANLRRHIETQVDTNKDGESRDRSQ